MAPAEAGDSLVSRERGLPMGSARGCTAVGDRGGGNHRDGLSLHPQSHAAQPRKMGRQTRKWLGGPFARCAAKGLPTRAPTHARHAAGWPAPPSCAAAKPLPSPEDRALFAPSATGSSVRLSQTPWTARRPAPRVSFAKVVGYSGCKSASSVATRVQRCVHRPLQVRKRVVRRLHCSFQSFEQSGERRVRRKV